MIKVTERFAYFLSYYKVGGVVYSSGSGTKAE